MMQHYVKTKEEYKDCILFYRLGDFYEMFFEDAEIVSKELELTLTGKDCGMSERAPMCGIPFHAAEVYLNRLISKGYKVAICEQMEDPKQTKGIVRREVIRVVTPGTTLNTQALDETKNNYIMSVVYVSNRFGIAIADITTGVFMVTEVDEIRKLLDEIYKFSPAELVIMSVVYVSNRFGIAIADITTGVFMVTEVDEIRKLLDEIYKFSPAELVCNEAFTMSGIEIDELKNRLNISLSALDNWYFDDDLCARTLKEHFHVGTLEGLGLKDYHCAVIAAGALFTYLLETQKNSMEHLRQITPYSTGLLIFWKHRKTPWSICVRLLRIVQTNICSLTAPQGVIWSLQKPCGKRQKEVLFYGYWIKPKQPWELV